MEVGTNRKTVCHFLLVINSNWHPISYRFGVIAAYCSNLGLFRPTFLSSLWGGLGTTYDVYLGLIGKRVVDLLLVLIELFSLRVTAEALRTKIDRKSAISLKRGQFNPNFHVESVAPPIILHGYLSQWMPHNFVLWVFTERNFAADFLQAKCEFTPKMTVLRFWDLFGGLWATYDDNLRLIGKRVVDFLLVLIEFFSLAVTAEALRANIGSKSAISLQRGAGWPKISGIRCRSLPIILLLRKLA